MLKIISSPKELDDSQLLDVYSDEFVDWHEREGFCNYMHDFLRQEGARCYVWCINDEYRCALRAEPYQDGYLIAGLETIPQYRQNGYAKQLLAAACSALQQQQKVPIYSHVGKRNVASMHAHSSCGFLEVLDYALFIDGSVSWNSCTLCLKP